MKPRSSNNAGGMDVSHHQGLIDWPKVKASKQIDFVFVKATEGVGYIDDQFKRNAAGANAVGIPVGYYHYAHPETNKAIDEARAFADAVKGQAAQLPYVLDLEGQASRLSKTLLTNWAYTFMQEIKRLTNSAVMLYTGAYFARDNVGSELGVFPLWVAHYGVTTPLDNGTWKNWSVFQYSETGSVNGITGKVDVNEMDREYWNTIIGGDIKVVKYNPQFIKERIIAVNGKLKFIDLNGSAPYATKGTDVRFIKLDKSRIDLDFKTRKDARVSDLLKEFGADLAINFPYFDRVAKIPVGMVWDGTKYINGDAGKTKKWRTISYKNGQLSLAIDILKTEVESSEFAFKGSPTLVSNSLPTWDYCNTYEETANDIGRDKNGILIRCQRTVIGQDINGDILIAISDGRTGSDQGATIEEMSLYLISKGAVWAVNGDGGSSTILAVKTPGAYSNLLKSNKYSTYKAGGINQDQNTGANESHVHHALLIFFK